MQRRFPMIDFDGIEVGLFEPEFGALMARRAVQTLVDRFVRAGGEYRPGVAPPVRRRAAQLDERPACSRARRIDGRPLRLRARPMAAEALPRRARPDASSPTRQEVFYFAHAAGRPPLPARRHARLGRLQRRRHVLRLSRPREPRRQVRPRQARRRWSIPTRRTAARREAALDEIVAFRDRRFPLLRGAPLTGARGLPI